MKLTLQPGILPHISASQGRVAYGQAMLAVCRLNIAILISIVSPFPVYIYIYRIDGYTI